MVGDDGIADQDKGGKDFLETMLLNVSQLKIIVKMKGTLNHKQGHLRPRVSEAQQPVTVCQKVPIHSKLMEKNFHVIWRLTNITGSTPLYFFSPVPIMRLIMEEASF